MSWDRSKYIFSFLCLILLSVFSSALSSTFLVKIKYKTYIYFLSSPVVGHPKPRTALNPQGGKSCTRLTLHINFCATQSFTACCRSSAWAPGDRQVVKFWVVQNSVCNLGFVYFQVLLEENGFNHKVEKGTFLLSATPSFKAGWRPIFRQIFVWRSAFNRPWNLELQKAQKPPFQLCEKLSQRVEHYFAERAATLWNVSTMKGKEKKCLTFEHSRQFWRQFFLSEINWCLPAGSKPRPKSNTGGRHLDNLSALKRDRRISILLIQCEGTC